MRISDWSSDVCSSDLRAADHMADRESNLGKFIDANTGKIIEQNKALLANERIKARDREKDDDADYLEARRRIPSVSEPGARIYLPPEARAAVARYGLGGGHAASSDGHPAGSTEGGTRIEKK